MSIDAGTQVAIILLACRPYVVIVNYLGQVLYLGRAPRTKETLSDFCECRVGSPTSKSIPRVDGLSTDTPVLGRHIMVRADVVVCIFFRTFKSRPNLLRDFGITCSAFFAHHAF